MKLEQNCNRKSQRLNIPIQVLINNVTCPVLDWSTIGLKVSYSGGDIALSDELPISIILPTGHSAIILDTKVIVRNINEDTYGLEIVELSEKNHKVLRHYATLAIDGNRNDIDDLSSDLFMRHIQTPIKEPVLLTDTESKEVHKSFLKSSLGYFIFGAILLVIVITTFFYNYMVIHHGIGLISGNAQNYKVPYDGLVKDVYVKIDQKVAKGQLLFEMQNSDDKEMLQTLNLQQNSLQKQIAQMKKTLVRLQKQRIAKSRTVQGLIQAEKKRLLSLYKTQKETYARAQYLYHKKLITFAKFSELQNQYFLFMDEYNNSILYKNSQSKEKKLAQQQLLKIDDQLIQTNNIISQLVTNMQKISVDALLLKQRIKNSIVLSKESGVIHNIFHKSGEQVEYPDDILTIQTFQKPYILTKTTTNKIAPIHIDEPCLLYSKRLDKSFYGKITGIGYSVTDSLTTNTTEISQNEIPIKIEFKEHEPDLELNEYLEVYIINDSTLSRKLFKIMPQSMLLL